MDTPEHLYAEVLAKTGPKLILIDNDEDDQEIFVMALEKLGKPVDVRMFSGGTEALAFLRKENFIPSFIFIDMNMPLMSGKECLGEIRKISALNNATIFIYSTAANPAAFDELIKLGAKDFLVKPSEFQGLIELLSKMIFPDGLA
jgi:CheY-like chemotaxis protein